MIPRLAPGPRSRPNTSTRPHARDPRAPGSRTQASRVELMQTLEGSWTEAERVALHKSAGAGGPSVSVQTDVSGDPSWHGGLVRKDCRRDGYGGWSQMPKRWWRWRFVCLRLQERAAKSSPAHRFGSLRLPVSSTQAHDRQGLRIAPELWRARKVLRGGRRCWNLRRRARGARAAAQLHRAGRRDDGGGGRRRRRRP